MRHGYGYGYNANAKKSSNAHEFLEKLRSIYIYIYACMYVRMSVCIYRM